eukprot:TRINITY_DN9006_c1_g1_i1.p1 TRINITY_DN9006_c1_g1~~TRINITY_DN9006_c1_g1_i1.p1  ORF type:complete len:2351 (+),score=420.17 TRINITY_DN9006_c1_g1_i1:492-7055(+)
MLNGSISIGHQCICGPATHRLLGLDCQPCPFGHFCEGEGCDEYLGGYQGKDYRGCQTTTRSGATCQAWTEQTPHTHIYTPAAYLDKGLYSNYCRNPSETDAVTIWCYTTDPALEWDYCDPLATSPSVSRCPQGKTTAGLGERSEQGCVCSEGHYFDDSTGTCEMCPAGRFQMSASLLNTCPEQCPAGMTSVEGASSRQECYCTEDASTAEDEYTKQVCGGSTGNEQQMLTVFEVPAVAGCLGLEELPPNLTRQEKELIITNMSEVIAEVIGGRSDTGCQFEHTDYLIELQCQVVTMTTDLGAGVGVVNASSAVQSCYDEVEGIAAGRRLEADEYGARQLGEQTTGAALSYTVRKAGTVHAERTMKYFQPQFMQRLLNDRLQDSSVSVTAVGALVITTVTEACAENKALPPYARYLSSTSCKCAVGWEPDQAGCKLCDIGYYKAIVSDDACKPCGDGATTLELGSNASTKCVCEEGKAISGGESSCRLCPVGQFCPLDNVNEPLDCPQGTATKEPGRTDVSDCLCSTGYGIHPTLGVCDPCLNGTYKDIVENELCSPCPPQMTSGRGATTVGECYCNPGSYLAGRDDLIPCELCTITGVACEGGLDPNTKKHRMPYAEPGYFLTGISSAAACPQLRDGSEICKGGGNSSTAPCHGNCSECAEGHDGFVCHTCIAGWTRNTAEDRCRPCNDLLRFGAWTLIGNLNLAIIGHSLVAHVQTAMAILASQGAKSLHSALFRLLQSWLLSMLVLKQFDFSRVEMFSWGNEAMRRHSWGKQKSKDEEEDSMPEQEKTFKAIVPEWFNPWTRDIFSFDLQVDIGQPTEWMGCLAEHFIEDEKEAQWWKHVLPAIYHASYPILLVGWTIVIGVILVYGLWEPLKRAGLTPAADPEENVERLKKIVKEAATQALQGEDKEKPPADMCEKLAKLPEAIKAWVKRKLGSTAQEDEPSKQVKEMIDDVTEIIFELSQYRGIPADSLRAIAEHPTHALTEVGEVLEEYASRDARAKKVLRMSYQTLLAFHRPAFQETPGGSYEHPSMKLVYEQPEAQRAMISCLMDIRFSEFVKALQTPSTFFETINDSIQGAEVHAEGVLHTSLYYDAFETIAKNKGLPQDVTQQVWRLLTGPLSQLPDGQRTELFTNLGPGSYDAIAKKVGTGAGDAMLLAKSRQSLLHEIQQQYVSSKERADEDRVKRVAGITFSMLLEAADVIGLEPDVIAADPGLALSVAVKTVASARSMGSKDSVSRRVSDVRERMKNLMELRRRRPLQGQLALRRGLPDESDMTLGPGGPKMAVQTVLDLTNNIREGATLQLWLSYFKVMQEVTEAAQAGASGRDSSSATAAVEETSLNEAATAANPRSAEELFEKLEYAIFSGEIAPFEVKGAAERGSWQRLIKKAEDCAPPSVPSFKRRANSILMAGAMAGFCDIGSLGTPLDGNPTSPDLHEDMSDDGFDHSKLMGSMGSLALAAAPDAAAQEKKTENEEKAPNKPKGDTHIKRPIFMLYRERPTFTEFFSDMRPLLLLLLYSTWFGTTKQMLFLVHCVPFYSRDEDAIEDDAYGSLKPYTRWMKHSEYRCFEGDHMAVGAAAIVGITIWSVGFIVALAVAIQRAKKSISTAGTLRLYAFFVMGYDVPHCTWDVIVKRLDILCTCMITYTNIAADAKAKLLCYAALAGLMLVLHADQKPFENRKTLLLDRIEFAGLAVRFVSFTAVELILVFNPYMAVSVVVCLLIVVACIWFMVNLWINIIIELVYDVSSKITLPTKMQLEITAALDKARGKTKKGCVSSIKTHVTKALAQIGKKGKMALLHGSRIVVDRLDKITDTTLVITPARVGDALAVQVVPRSMREQQSESCYDLVKKFVWTLQLMFFHQTDARQENFLATVIGDLWQHLLVEVHEDTVVLGVGQVAQFVLIARALKCIITDKIVALNAPAHIKAEALKTKLAWAVRAHEEATNEAVPEEKPERNLSARSVQELQKEANKTNLSAEDLNSALNILQRISRENCKELFKAAYDAIEERRLETQAKNSQDFGCQAGRDQLLGDNEIAAEGPDLLAILERQAEPSNGPSPASSSDRRPWLSSTPAPRPHAGDKHGAPWQSLSLPRPPLPPPLTDPVPTGEMTRLPRTMMPPGTSARLAHWGQEAKIDTNALLALLCVPHDKIDEVLDELEATRRRGNCDLNSHTHDVVSRVLRDDVAQ